METNGPPTLPKVLPWLTPRYLIMGLAVLSLLIIVGLTYSMFSLGPLPPATAKPPPPPKKKVELPERYSAIFYKGRVEADAKKVALKDFDLASLKRVNTYYAEFSGSQALKPGSNLETEHLLLKATLSKVWVGEEGSGFKAAHLSLSITNKMDKHLAYRIITDAPGKYESKGVMIHNAIAIKPGQTLTRTESLPPKKRGALTIKRVEILEISPLGFYYVSRLDPERLQYDSRTSAGHQAPEGLSQCKLLPWRTFKQALEREGVQWYDIIDFYSRHDCNDYTFFKEYRHNGSGPKRIPFLPPSLSQKQ